MINCNTCNKLIPDDSEFCPFCGEKITRQAEENTENPYSLHLYQTDALLKRVFLFLEDGEFEHVDEFCEHILNQEPENPRAYLAKMMAELQVKQQADLANLEIPFDTNKNYQKVIRFADSTLATELQTYSESVKERIAKKAEDKRIESLYLDAVADFKSNDVTRIQKASESFALLGGYKDSEEHIAFCQEKIDSIRKEEEKRRIERERLAEEKRIADEKARLEKERQEEIDRIEAEKKRRRLIKISKAMLAVIAIVLLLASVCFFVLYQLSPASKFQYIKTGDKKITITGVKNERGIIEDGVLSIPKNILGLPIARITDEAFDNISFEVISYEGDAYHWGEIIKSNDLLDYSVKHAGLCIFSDWFVEPGFDCVNGGKETRYCVACKKEETRNIAPGEHITKELSYVPPTCLETGLTEGAECRVCGLIIEQQTSIEATGHTVVIDSAKTPTCIKTGLTEGSHCAICNEILVEQKIVGVADHTPVVDASVSPTCTQTGLTEGSHCSVCETILVPQYTINVLSHSYGNWQVIKDATCTQTGTQKRVCSLCNKTVVANIEVKEHDYDNRVCSDCGAKQPSEGLAYVINGNGYAVSGLGNCTDTEIVIPETYKGKSVNAISNNAFEDCSWITEVVIPDGVVTIGEGAFVGCRSLVKIHLPATLKSCGRDAFGTYYDTLDNLKEVHVEDLGAYCQIKMSGLSSPFHQDYDHQVMLYENGVPITNLIIPSTVTSIGEAAFYYYKALRSLTISEGVVEIQDYAFSLCTNLKTVTIPSTLKYIGSSAFDVTVINYNGTRAQWLQIEKESNWNHYDSCVINCIDGSITL